MDGEFRTEPTAAFAKRLLATQLLERPVCLKVVREIPVYLTIHER